MRVAGDMSEYVWSEVLGISDRKRQFGLLSSDCNAENGFSGMTGIKGRGLKTLGLSIAIFAGSFSTISYQDMQTLAMNNDRWLVHLPQAPGESVASASMGMFDMGTTGSLREVFSTGLGSGDIERLTIQVPDGLSAAKTPTINRQLKGDRVISSTVQRPPAYFTAGSVIRKQGLLSPLGADKKQSLAFVKPKSWIEAFKIASEFHAKEENEPKKVEKLPVMVASLVRESESSILAYSTDDKVKYSPFAAVLRDDSPKSSIPKLNRNDHSWADDPLPKLSYSKKQQQCLAAGIYFESRGESVRGQAAVAQVILNRVRNPKYPNSICGVVYQNKNHRNACQFSFACDRKRDRVNNKSLWKLAQHVAKETTAGRIWLSRVGSSTHYHANYVLPKWAGHMKKVGKIGLHIFYRTKGGGWS
jgi:spore germination cell wall hydrolase CwlJ-like protein